MHKGILVDINNTDSNNTASQNDPDNDDTHQQATSNNVKTYSDCALEYDVRENDKLNSNEEEIDDPLYEYRAPVCEICLESIIPNYPLVNAQVICLIQSPSECSSSVLFFKVKCMNCINCFNRCL